MGCYSPSFPENQPCSETQSCPGSLTCDLATNECVSEVPDAAHFVQIANNHRHVCAIDDAKRLWCWGRNDRGELGLGDTDDRTTPTRVGIDSDWIQVGVGEGNTCGLRATGQLYCWGIDFARQADHTVPSLEPGTFKSLAVGHEGWCAINSADDKLTCRRIDDAMSVAEPFPFTVTAVAIQHTTICAITPDHDLYCWGGNNANQVGNNDGTTPTADAAFHVTGKFQQVELGEDHTCALSDDHRLLCWGNCGQGQVGRTTDCGIPTPVDAQQYAAFATGDGHTCAIGMDGKLRCFGSNASGQLGTLGGRAQTTPATIEGFDGWTQVSAGQSITCALRGPDNETWCWGSNSNGQLGDDGGGTVVEPVMTDPGPFQRVFMGEQNGCAIHEDGSLWCWGANAFGQLGDNTTLERRRPLQIGSDHDWVKVALAHTSACGIRTDGTLWCWGDNTDRQLGLGANREVHVPTQVGSSTGWTDVAVDATNACGVQNGTLFCWGAGRSSVPESLDFTVSSLDGLANQFAWIESTGAFSLLNNQPINLDTTFTDWTSLDTGTDHTCGLRNGGELWCTGANYRGQCGTDDTNTQATMVREFTMGTFTKVSAGDAATCAIDTTGKLWCTGDETLIAHGPEGNVDHLVPIGTATWIDVSIGGSDGCGIQTGGALYCWGIGSSSGRGDGKGGHERPTRVSPQGAGS